MEKSRLIQRLMRIFLGELEELIDTLENGVEALERADRPDERTQALETLFRAGHSLKGAAHAVDNPRFESAGHYLEGLFAGMRQGTAPVDAETLTLLRAKIAAMRTDAARLAIDALAQDVQPPVPGRSASTRRHLLVVDDSPTTRNMVKEALETAEYRVTAFEDGLTAWQCLQEQSVDLVVSDVEMPRMDGYGLIEKIRAAPHLSRLPVVLLTALENEVDRQRGLLAGATAYLFKSEFSQVGFLRIITQSLQNNYNDKP
ncbi:response regulator [Oceanibaculum pacificum]|uniref:Response regulatory domain-containing protein n=1 Tax=Oceanibaculum pacificum TaxID=580166 RepID=A0A154VXY8_9PROT|nr:response regulator [Oceanibaculum pacificum]KZD06194.1 hypothetical protein AUP43_11150 [Oceanibaculum pacificum]